MGSSLGAASTAAATPLAEHRSRGFGPWRRPFAARDRFVAAATFCRAGPALTSLWRRRFYSSQDTRFLFPVQRLIRREYSTLRQPSSRRSDLRGGVWTFRFATEDLRKRG